MKDEIKRDGISLFSHGGSGLKFLHRFLDEHANVRSNDRNPHVRPNNSDILHSEKAILIYSDPRNAIMSFFRRSYSQSRRQFKPIDELWLNECLSHLGIDHVFPRGLTMENYLTNYDKDIFDLKGYFEEWLNYDLKDGYSLAFVKYEEIINCADDIVDFIGLDNLYADKLRGRFSPRRSSHTNTNQAVSDLLHERYGALIEIQNELPGFYIKGQ